MQPLIDRKSAASALAVSERTIRRWTDDGKLPCVRLSPQTIRYKVDDIERMRRWRVPSAFVAALVLVVTPAMPAAPITDRLIDAVAHVESGHDHEAVGDGGRARTAWQLHRAAWKDASAYLKKNGHTATSYDAGVTDPAQARKHAAAYLGLTNARLKKRLGREPSVGELYAAHNLGVGGFAKRDFDLAQTPTITQRAVAKLRAFLEAE